MAACRVVPCWSAPLLLLVTAFAPSAPRDGESALASMKERTAKLERVHLLVRNETQIGDAAATVRYLESVIDVRAGQVRTLVRDFGRATPHLLCVYADGVLRVKQLECGQVAEQLRTFSLADALSVTTAGELAVAAFAGLPPSVGGAIGKASLAEVGETVAGVGCTRVGLPAKGSADLWIGDGDGFPRRLRAQIGSLRLEEEVIEIDLASDLRRVDFSIVVPQGRRLLDLAQARRDWAALSPEADRWPKPGEDSPDFAGADLDGAVRLLSETSERDVVLAFWNPEVSASVDQAGTLEAAWRERTRKELLFWHVAAGRGAATVRAAVARSSLRETVVIAGEHAQNAFQQFSIWRCPVFVHITDMQVVAISDDLAVAKRWLR